MLRWKASLKPTSGGGGGVPTPDLLWWKMKPGSGTAIDADVGSDGTFNGTWSTGASGSGYSIESDGTQTASTDSSIAYSSNIITISFWASLDTFSNDYMLNNAGTGNGTFEIYASSASSVLFRLFGSSGERRTTVTTTLSTATWYNFFVVFDNSTASGDVKVWLNGSRVTNTNVDNKAGISNIPTGVLNVMHLNGSWIMDGRVDDLRIWAGDQSAHVAEVYANPDSGGGSTFPATSLVGFYKLGEASGADALDSGGNGRTFSDNGTVAATTGTIGGETVNVRTLDRPAGKYFSRTDDANFDVGDGESFTISFWAKVSSSMGNYDTGGIFTKRHNVTASDAGYQICLRKVNSTTYVRYNAVCDGTTTVGDTNTDTGVATDAWAHYIMVFTADATIITYVNNAQYSSVDASSVTGALTNSKDNYIGQLAYNNNGSIIADVTHLGFWKKALDSSERTALYNSGKVLAPAAPTPLQTRTVTFTSISEFTIDSDSGQKIWTDQKLNQANVGNGLRLWNGSEAGNSGATESSGKWVFSSAGNCTTWWESYYMRVKQDPGTGTYSDWINLTDASGDIYTSCQAEYNNIGSYVSNYSGPGTWTTHASGFKYQVEIYSASARPG